MAWSKNLGRTRTKLGAFIDKKGITQLSLTKWSGISRPVVTWMCSDPEYRPSDMSKRRVVDALNKNGHDCGIDSFWT